MRMLLIVPVLLLAGCGPGAEQNAVTNAAPSNVAAADDAANKVLALNDRERNAVFVRALIDSNLPCDGVTASTRMPDQNGRPVWRAECKNGDKHIISITPDGTAEIVSRAR